MRRSSDPLGFMGGLSLSPEAPEARVCVCGWCRYQAGTNSLKASSATKSGSAHKEQEGSGRNLGAYAFRPWLGGRI